MDISSRAVLCYPIDKCAEIFVYLYIAYIFILTNYFNQTKVHHFTISQNTYHSEHGYIGIMKLQYTVQQKTV